MATGGHRAAQCEQLVLGGIGARDGFTVDGPVRLGARGREAQRAGLDGLLDDARHSGDIVGVGCLVARPPLTHHVAADRAVGHLGSVIDCQFLLLDCVEIFGEALPLPGDALGQGRTGDVLDAFHQFDEPLLTTRCDGREPDAAVTADHGGHPVQTGWLEQSVPADLAVVVCVNVYESGRHDPTGGVDGLRGRPDEAGIVALAAAHLDDHPVLDADIGPNGLAPGAVDDGASGDRQVVHANASSTDPRDHGSAGNRDRGENRRSTGCGG